MAEKLTVAKRDELLIELKTAVVGIPGTDERGMAGDIKEIKEVLKKQNDKIEKTRTFAMKNRIALVGLLCFLTGLGVLEWQDVIHIFGG